MLLDTAAQNNAYQRTEKTYVLFELFHSKLIKIVAYIVCAITFI